MSSDIKLGGEWIVVEGNVIRLRTTDLMLDAPGRRKNGSGQRRALVHDHEDGLTINWANDYPGGVTINGPVKSGPLTIIGQLKSNGDKLRLHVHDIILDHPSRRKNNTGTRRALVHDFSDGLTINWANDYSGGVTIKGKLVLGDDDVTDIVVILGPGLQINNALSVRGDAIFNNPIRTPDVIIAQPPGPGYQRQPESLLKRIEKLEAEVQALKAKVESP